MAHGLQGFPERRLRSRRRHSAFSFLYGGVRPRPRTGRRHDDHQRVFLDWHESHVLYLAIAIVLMSAIDAFLTLNLLRLGGEEVNVAMEALLVRDAQIFLYTKILVTSLSVTVLAVLARRHVLGVLRVERLLQAVCVSYALLLGYEYWLLNIAVGHGRVGEHLRQGLLGG